MPERTPLDPFLRATTMAHRRVFNVAGVPVAFESNAAWPLALAADAFGELPAARARRAPLAMRCLVTDDDAGAEFPPNTLTFGDARTETALITRADSATCNLAARSGLITFSEAARRNPLRARIDLIEFATYRLTQHALKAIGLHSACIARNGRGLLVMGDSGAGKSTLVAHALCTGWDVIAEDSTFLLPGHIRARGVPAFIHLMQESMDMFAGAGFDRCVHDVVVRRSGRKKYEIDVRRFRGRPLPVETRVCGIVFLQASAGERAASPKRRALPARSVPAQLRQYQPFAAEYSAWPAATQTLAGLPAIMLTPGRDLAATGEALAQFLSTSP